MAGPTVAFQFGTHASRPAANSGIVLYACTTHNKLERSDGSTFADYADLAGSGIQATIVDAKGDLIAATAADTVARLAVGSNGQKLKADSGQSSGLAWVDDLATVQIIIDGGGSAIATGVKGYVTIPFAWSDITEAILLADQSGSIVVDVWKDTYANYPPVDADSITASAPMTISSATKSRDTTLTGWTKTGSAGDVLGFNVDSATTVTRVTAALTLKKS